MQKYAKFILGILVLGLIVYFIALRPQSAAGPMNPQSPQAKIPKTTTLFFAGDIMLSRNVAGKIIEAKDNTLPFKNVADKISNADIAFANLESPFLDKGPYAQQGLVFKADPATIEGIKHAGIDVLSTANNHAYDQGLAGIKYTLSWLTQHGILAVGTSSICHDGVIVEKNGLKFGYLAYSYTAFNNGGKDPDPWVCDWNDTKQIATDVVRLKSKTDFVIVSGQFGIEYQRQPEKENVSIAHAAVDAGADLVIGHHPHWIQTTEQYKGKWIFYSLGNFVFDQMWSQDTKEGLTLQLTLEDKELAKIELWPVVIENYCCPRWANPEETKTILNKINLTDQVLMNNN